MQYKKGEYIVLLSTCDGRDETWESSLDANYVYKLSSDFSPQSIQVDKNLRGDCNGWTCGDYYDSKLAVRYASVAEIRAYEEAGRAIPAFTPKELDYEIY